jgi:hypothetical protein
LGKQATEGTMTVYPLHDQNSNYYADAENVANCSPALLNGTQGDVWMYEPKYYYKGINDYLHNKKYSCFSASAEMPDSPVCTVFSYNDLLTAGNVREGFKLLLGNLTVDSASVADANYSVCKVDVSGRKKVRFPTTLGSSMICSAFSDNSGNVISTLTVPTLNHRFSDGMYLIADIPTSATRLYFTILKNAEFDCVVLSDSIKIEDMEQDWVEHPACLTAVFEATAIGSAIYSAITGGTSVSGLSPGDFNQYAIARKLQLVDYEMHKDVANLFFAYYGRRDSQGQCGYGQNTNVRIIGTTSILGMRETVNRNNAVDWAWYPVTDEFGTVTYVQIASTNCIGYENWFGNKAEWMGKVGIPNSTTAEQHKWAITMPDGTVRKVKAGTANGYMTGTVHQKYMDIIGAFAQAGSSSTFYCDEFTSSTAAGRVVWRSNSYASAFGGVSYAYGGYDSSITSANFGSRLAFRGQIVKAGSVTAYKALTAIA